MDHSPGFIGREWIETRVYGIRGSSKNILPALLVGSGLKPAPRWGIFWRVHSPGFIGREWIETYPITPKPPQQNHSPGFIGREWIETRREVVDDLAERILPALLVGSGLKRALSTQTATSSTHSPGFIGREWIETEYSGDMGSWCGILPALLVGSGLKL